MTNKTANRKHGNFHVGEENAASGNRELKGNGLPDQLASRFASQPKVWLTGATQCGRGNRCLRGGIGVLSGGAGRWFGLFGIAGSAVCEPMGGGKKCSHECFAPANPQCRPDKGGEQLPDSSRRTVQIAFGSVWRTGIGTGDRVAAPSTAKGIILTNATLSRQKEQ